MHALSFHTWVIHISSVLEWMLAIAAVTLWGERRAEPEWRWLAVAMLQLWPVHSAPAPGICLTTLLNCTGW